MVCLSSQHNWPGSLGLFLAPTSSFLARRFLGRFPVIALSFATEWIGAFRLDF